MICANNFGKKYLKINNKTYKVNYKLKIIIMRMNIQETSTQINIIYIDQLLIYKSKTMTGELNRVKKIKLMHRGFLEFKE